MVKKAGHPTDRYIDHTLVSVAPILGKQKLFLEWDTDEQAVIDFAELIQNHTRFKAMSTPAVFHAVSVVDWGAGIEWKHGTGMGSDQLRLMADQQKSVIHRQKKAG